MSVVTLPSRPASSAPEAYPVVFGYPACQSALTTATCPTDLLFLIARDENIQSFAALEKLRALYAQSPQPLTDDLARALVKIAVNSPWGRSRSFATEMVCDILEHRPAMSGTVETSMKEQHVAAMARHAALPVSTDSERATKARAEFGHEATKATLEAAIERATSRFQTAPQRQARQPARHAPHAAP